MELGTICHAIGWMSTFRMPGSFGGYWYQILILPTEILLTNVLDVVTSPIALDISSFHLPILRDFPASEYSY